MKIVNLTTISSTIYETKNIFVLNIDVSLIYKFGLKMVYFSI